MLLFLLFYLVVIPLSVFIHELGHAFAVLLSTNANARVYLGPFNEANKENFKIGRIHFHIKWATYGSISLSNLKGEVSKKQNIIIAAGGPLVSLIVAVLVTICSFYVINNRIESFLQAIAIYNYLSFLWTIIPMTYPSWMKAYRGMPSDGLRIVKALKNEKV
jgi:hypothetical protein